MKNMKKTAFLLFCLMAFAHTAAAAEPVTASRLKGYALSGAYAGQSISVQRSGVRAADSGAAVHDAHNPAARLEKQRSDYTWSIGYGVGVEVNEKVSLDFGYRFGEIDDLEARTWSGYQDEGWSGLSGESRGDVHQLGVSLRYRF